jgi:hypothetical protein
VPTYQPAAVYGPTYAVPATPYYPSFWGTPAGAATTGVVSFGAGMATGALIGSAFNWGSNDVYVNRNWGGAHGFHGNANVNKNVDINKNVNVQKWEYDPQHRRGVGYRDPAVAKRYSGRDQLAAGSRPDHTHVRGFEPGTANRRPPGGGGGPGQGGPGQSGGQPATRAAGKNPPSRPNRPSGGGSAAGQRTANRPAPPRPAKPNDAFGDVGRGARDASRRGAASRGVPSRAGNGGSGQPRRSGGGGGGGGGGHGGGGGGGRGGRRH